MKAGKRAGLLRRVAEYRMFLILILMAAVLQIASGGVFLRKSNILNLFNQNFLIGIVTIGQFLVILTGGIDLSVGSVVMISSLMYVSFQHLGVAASIALSVATGCGFGLINALCVTKLKINAFITTLATMEIARGLGNIMVGGQPVFNIRSEFLNIGRIKLFSVSIYVYVWIVLALAMCWVLRYTTFGARLYATGGNETVSRLSGVKVGQVKGWAYVLSGCLCGLAGAMYTMRLQIADPVIGTDMAMDAITAVVIGGAALSGGEGKLANTLLGVLILGMLNNFMNILGVPSAMHVGVKGGIMVATVLMNNALAKRAR